MNQEKINNQMKEKKELSNQKQLWISTLKEVLQHFSPEEQIKEFEIDSKAPYLLEDSTFDNKKEKKYQFLILTAPSGVGKGTVGGIMEKQGIKRLARVNTRHQRPGEDPRAYNFVSEEQFKKMKDNEELICSTDSGHNQAAIEKKTFFAAIKKGQPFYIDSGAGTARQIKEETELKDLSFSTIFLLPPHFDEMINRLSTRNQKESELLITHNEQGGTMTNEVMENRVNIAIQHLKESIKTTDFFVVNDEAERAAKKISSLLE